MRATIQHRTQGLPFEQFRNQIRRTVALTHIVNGKMLG